MACFLCISPAVLHCLYSVCNMCDTHYILAGLTPRGITELFNILDRDSGKYTFAVSCYMLELYQDDLADLLLPASQKQQGPQKVPSSCCVLPGHSHTHSCMDKHTHSLPVASCNCVLRLFCCALSTAIKANARAQTNSVPAASCLSGVSACGWDAHI